MNTEILNSIASHFKFSHISVHDTFIKNKSDLLFNGHLI